MIFYCKLPTQCDIEDLRYRLSKSLSIAANASLGMLRLSRSWLTWSLLHPHLGPTFKYKYKYNVQVQVQTTNTTTWDQYHLQIPTRLTYTKHDVNTTSISARRTIKANQHVFFAAETPRELFVVVNLVQTFLLSFYQLIYSTTKCPWVKTQTLYRHQINVTDSLALWIFDSAAILLADRFVAIGLLGSKSESKFTICYREDKRRCRLFCFFC